MAFKELSPLAREQYLTKQINQLKAIYRLEQKKLAQLLVGTDLTDFSRARAEAILKQVDQIVEALNGASVRWVDAAIPQSYARGLDLAGERLKALNITRFVSQEALVHTQAVSVLIDDVSIQLLQANDGIKKFFNTFIRRTQQRIIEDVQISKLVAQGVVEGSTRRTVSDALLQELRKKMGNQQFVVVNGRNYDPTNYAEMIARSRTREASTQGSINTALRYGVDLVQWDVHAGVCPYCAQFAGRVYSISGADPNFPTLDVRPPAHPNCECVIIPVTKANLERRGNLDNLIKLSNSPSVEVSSFSRFQELLNTI